MLGDDRYFKKLHNARRYILMFCVNCMQSAVEKGIVFVNSGRSFGTRRRMMGELREYKRMDF